MVLISVDLPQPFGPRMQTCSPASMRSETPSSAGRSVDSPRTTVTSCKARRGGGVVISDSCERELYLNRAEIRGKGAWKLAGVLSLRGAPIHRRTHVETTGRRYR